MAILFPNTTDNYISLPLAPAFTENIAAMLEKVVLDGGTSPTISRPGGEGADIIYDPMHGTGADNGRSLIHFRLPIQMDETALLLYLEAAMPINPKPPLTVVFIRSAYNIVDVLDGEGNIIDTEPLIIKVADKAGFLPFMDDIQDGVDGNGDPIMRSPTAGDIIGISHYAASDAINI